MPLVRLIYTSSISEQFTAADIGKILESARQHSTRTVITGILYFNKKFFLQCLEGSAVMLAILTIAYSRTLATPMLFNWITAKSAPSHSVTSHLNYSMY